MKFIFEPSFSADLRKLKRTMPGIMREFESLLSAVSELGRVPEAYGPHELSNPGGSYSGFMEFHLAEGRFDVVVIYMPHKTNPAMRFVRIGSHEDLFHGPIT